MGQSFNGYILWHPRTGKLIQTKHVKIREKLTFKNIDRSKDLENLSIIDDSPELENVDENAIELFDEIPTDKESDINSKPSEVKKKVRTKGSKRKLDDIVCEP